MPHLLSLCLAAAAFAALAASATPAAAAPQHTSEQLYQMALESQSAREYPAMLQLLRRAARAGHVEAQEMLALVLLAGPTVYGAAVPADRCEAGHWSREAFARGSLVAWQQMTFLNRLRSAPSGQRACPDMQR